MLVGLLNFGWTFGMVCFEWFCVAACDCGIVGGDLCLDFLLLVFYWMCCLCFIGFLCCMCGLELFA